MDDLFSIGTEKVDFENVHILDVTEESMLICDPEGRELELDLDAITRFDI